MTAQQKIDALAKLVVTIAVSCLAVTVIWNLIAIRSIQDWEVRTMRSKIEPAIEDRFRAADHHQFVNDLFKANPQLTRPKDW